MLQVHMLSGGMAEANAYAVVNRDQEALIFDPGLPLAEMIAWIDGNKWQPQAILLTHAHYDHIATLDPVRDHYQIPVYVHALEAEWLGDPNLNLSAYTGGPQVSMRPADQVWDKSHMGDQSVAGFNFQLAFLPGHSPGHVIYHFLEEGFVICGDTVFRGSIGRTDFPGGDHVQLLAGIHQEILTLPEATRLYSGHTPVTTVGVEKQTNPFLNHP